MEIKVENHTESIPREKESHVQDDTAGDSHRTGIQRLWPPIGPLAITSPSSEVAKNVRCHHVPSPASSLRLMNSNRYLPDSCLLWTPSQIHSLPLSQRTQNFNVLPDLSWQKPHRTAGLNQSAGVEREAKTLASYNQSPSLVLFLKPCLHLCIVLNLYYTLYLT